MRRDGPVVELFAQNAVFARSLVAIHGRAQYTPADAEARLRQATERTFQAFCAWQHVAGGTRQSASDKLEVTDAAWTICREYPTK